MKQAAFLLTLTTFSLYGQDKANVNSMLQRHKLQIGLNVSPDFCYRTTRNVDGDPKYNSFIELMNKNETFKVGLTVGLNLCFTRNNSYSFETGIQYANKGIKTKIRDLYPLQPDPQVPEKFRSVESYHCLDIPLKVNYTTGKKKLQLISSFGLTTNIFIIETSTSYLYFTDRKEKERLFRSSGYDRVNISAALSIGLNYRMNDKNSLRIEPSFRHVFIKRNSTNIGYYLYSAGLNIGYYVHL